MLCSSANKIVSVQVRVHLRNAWPLIRPPSKSNKHVLISSNTSTYLTMSRVESRLSKDKLVPFRLFPPPETSFDCLSKQWPFGWLKFVELSPSPSFIVFLIRNAIKWSMWRSHRKCWAKTIQGEASRQKPLEGTFVIKTCEKGKDPHSIRSASR